MKTIEQKAKAYDEALGRAKQIRNGNPSSGTAIVVCEQIFPELRESEDERIRKEIIHYFSIELLSSKEDVDKVILKKWISYLEKQKEHVPENAETGTREQKPNHFDVLENAAREFRAKNVPPIEPISDELVEIIKEEFEGFRNLLKKKGIEYEPQRSYWEAFARLFDSSAREYVKEQNLAIMKPHKGDDGNPYDMCVSDAQDYAIKRGFGVPFNDGEVYVDGRHITQTIGNILRWADEHPKEQKPVEIDERKIINKHITKEVISTDVYTRLKECGWRVTTSNDTQAVVSSFYEHVEYIRKDALLEWAKEMKEQVSIGLNAYDMGEENGKAEMLNNLIDKLNSL